MDGIGEIPELHAQDLAYSVVNLTYPPFVHEMKAGNNELYIQPDTVQINPILQPNMKYTVLHRVVKTIYIIYM
jgi:hypothetical protein